MRIGIDLGGTRVKAGVVNGDGRVVLRIVEDVGAARDGASIAGMLAGIVGRLSAGAEAPVESVGIAAAGVLERATDLIRESPNYPEWRDLPLGAMVARATGLPTRVDNDANAVILGEALAGAARGVPHLVGLTLGTGVGGAIVLDGRVWRGARGMAGELGHVTVVPDGRPCGCGNRGCLEQYAGAVGIRQGLREAGGDLADLADRADAPRLAAARARSGDAGAQAVFDRAGDALGQAIAGFVHALDVTCVVLAGGLVKSEDRFGPALRRSFAARTFASMAEGVRVVSGVLGEDAGVVGAALGARDR